MHMCLHPNIRVPKHTVAESPAGAAIVKPKAGPSKGVFNEEDWNNEVDENAQGADAYRYSKVCLSVLSRPGNHIHITAHDLRCIGCDCDLQLCTFHAAGLLQSMPP